MGEKDIPNDKVTVKATHYIHTGDIWDHFFCEDCPVYHHTDHAKCDYDFDWEEMEDGIYIKHTCKGSGSYLPERPPSPWEYHDHGDEKDEV